MVKRMIWELETGWPSRRAGFQRQRRAAESTASSTSLLPEEPRKTASKLPSAAMTKRTRTAEAVALAARSSEIVGRGSCVGSARRVSPRGRGVGVGAGRGVAVGRGIAVGRGSGVGRGVVVGRGVGVAVGSGRGVGVGRGVEVGTGVGVEVGTGVGVGVGLGCVGVGVNSGVGGDCTPAPGVSGELAGEEVLGLPWFEMSFCPPLSCASLFWPPLPGSPGGAAGSEFGPSLVLWSPKLASVFPPGLVDSFRSVASVAFVEAADEVLAGPAEVAPDCARVAVAELCGVAPASLAGSGVDVVADVAVFAGSAVV